MERWTIDIDRYSGLDYYEWVMTGGITFEVRSYTLGSAASESEVDYIDYVIGIL